MKYEDHWWAASITTAVIASVLLTGVYSGWGDWFDLVTGVLFTVGLSVAFKKMMQRRDATYTDRMKADRPVLWDVWVNDVRVGPITDAQYASLQQQALRDGRNAWAQVLNIGNVITVALSQILVLVPVAMFWLAVGLAVSAPDALSTIILEIRGATPESLVTLAGMHLQIALYLVLMAYLVMFGLGLRFGFKNQFAAGVARLVRQHCKTPAEGEVRIRRVQELETVADT